MICNLFDELVLKISYSFQRDGKSPLFKGTQQYLSGLRQFPSKKKSFAINVSKKRPYQIIGKVSQTTAVDDELFTKFFHPPSFSIDGGLPWLYVLINRAAMLWRLHIF